ncbi:MAG: alpha/beta hydrolase [Acidobacteriia bacterium]|nr:alpha/beta hydrolase [Terriglobia bacterium]
MKFIAGSIAAALSLSVALYGAMIDGAKINWATAGKGEKVIVFVHGWTCDSTTWSKNVPAVARKYQAITLDLPGHGKSGMPRGEFSMDLFAKAIEGVRRDAKVDKMILVGHSMGTPVIRQYARLFPQHVAALVLVDGTVIDAKTAAGFAGVADRFKTPDASKTRVEFIRSMFTPLTPPDLKTRIEKMMTAPPDAAAAGSMAAMGDPAIWKEDAINVPVLGIYADKSRLGNRELLSKLFPSIEYTEIPGTDHFLMLEKPEEFNRVLMAFLDKQ